MVSQLGHSLYNVNQLVTISVQLSHIPFVFLPPSLPSSFPFSLLSLTFSFFQLSHLPSPPFISYSSPSVLPSFGLRPYLPSHLIPPSISPSIPATLLLPPSPCKRTRPGLAPLIAFRMRKRDTFSLAKHCNYDYGSTK